jgi:hypothetical protein
MTTPCIIKLGYRSIAVTYADLPQTDGEQQLGAAHMDTSVIDLCAKSSIPEAANTLFHELLHFMLHDAGLTYLLPEGMEEAIVMCLANGMTEAMKRNPELLAHFQETFNGQA